MKGKFITFEGGEGSGKSTQTALIKEYLERIGKVCVTTREPGGTKVGEAIRNVVLFTRDEEIYDETEMLLFAASRIQLVNKFIIPNMQKGNIVLCDRYIDSSFVYQGLTNGNKIDMVKTANSFAMAKVMPDVTIYFDISPEEAFARKNGADKADRMEMKGLDFHHKVRDGFLTLAKMFPERIVVIDATRPVEEVTDEIIDIFKNKGIID